MSAYADLMDELRDGEYVEAVVFGPWGWGDSPREGQEWEFGYAEPDPPFVPFSKRCQVLSIDEAALYMEGWSFEGGLGAPGYAVYIWTNERVFWATQYDGATELDCAPRHPTATIPYMPGS